MNEVGMDIAASPVNELQPELDKRFVKRLELVTKATSDHAESLKQKAGEEQSEGVLAKLLNSHENVNNIFRSAAQWAQTPEQLAAYLDVVNNTIEALTEGLAYGNSADIVHRQEGLANNPNELPSVIKQAIKQIGGTSGPTQTSFGEGQKV